MGEPNGRDRNKDRKRRALLLPLLLLIPFALGGLSVSLLRGESRAVLQGTPSGTAGNAGGANCRRHSDRPGRAGPSDPIAHRARRRRRRGPGRWLGLHHHGRRGQPHARCFDAHSAHPHEPERRADSRNEPDRRDCGGQRSTGLHYREQRPVTQSNVSAANPIAVPAKGSMTLRSAPSAPQITLLNLPGVNQGRVQEQELRPHVQRKRPFVNATAASRSARHRS